MDGFIKVRCEFIGSSTISEMCEVILYRPENIYIALAQPHFRQFGRFVIILFQKLSTIVGIRCRFISKARSSIVWVVQMTLVGRDCIWYAVMKS